MKTSQNNNAIENRQVNANIFQAKKIENPIMELEAYNEIISNYENNIELMTATDIELLETAEKEFDRLALKLCLSLKQEKTTLVVN